MPGEMRDDPAHTACQRARLALGFQALGVKVHTGFIERIETKRVACWGWRTGQVLREAGHEVLVMERGYIGDRFHYTSLGWNGLNGHASFPYYPDDAGARFHEHGGVMQPWKSGGDYILILGQVRNDASLQGKDISDFYARQASQIARHYGKPVYFRPHPEAKRRLGYYGVDGVKNLEGTLQEALEGALFTVAFNSNSCLDSVLAGVPCLAGDKGTMAYQLCMTDYREIITPDRERIAGKIAWTQWAPEEVESGEALKAFIQ